MHCSNFLSQSYPILTFSQLLIVQAALLASSHPLALLLLTRAGVLGSNSASLQLASLYSSGVVRGVSPSVVLIHRDPIRSISWLIRSNEILKAQVQEVQMEKDRLKKESSLSGAFGGKRPGMGHRRSLSGQSQRAGLIPDIQLSVTTSKMIANCPFSSFHPYHSFHSLSEDL